MYAGISSEFLWKASQKNWGMGFELNFVKQREFNQLFDLKRYSVTTGHASVYYEAKNSILYQIDFGRYLAGDWGTTLTLMREFNNGWRLGAYATLTDIHSKLLEKAHLTKVYFSKSHLTR